MKFAVIGHPIAHSKSPLMHHANFKALNRDDDYTALDIPPGHFHHIRDIIAEYQLDGFNVTIPHKTAIMSYLDWIDESAQMIGAVNTVKVTDGRLAGYNTDGIGFVQSLEQHFQQVTDQKILLIGAGGASRAVAYTLQHAGNKVTVANRTVSRTADWPFAVETIALKDINLSLEQYDVIINTTPVGMTGFDNEIICDLSLAADAFVADIIYTPPETPFLRQAELLGLQTMNGLGMFVNQGALSFELWTGREADRTAMRRAVQQS